MIMDKGFDTTQLLSILVKSLWAQCLPWSDPERSLYALLVSKASKSSSIPAPAFIGPPSEYS